MKVGEFYKSIYNHYVAKVVKVTRHEVTLENRQGVKEYVLIDNFDLNWKKCENIYAYRNAIEEAFSKSKLTITMQGDCVVVYDHESNVQFSIFDNLLRVQFSDDVKEALEADYNVMEFLLEDAFEVIDMIANLFE